MADDDLWVFPDGEQLVIDWLRDRLDVPVEPKVPNPRPASWVKVTRVGGPRRDLVTDHPMLVVEAWDDDDADARDLLQLARAHVDAMRGQVIDDVTVYGITEVGGPANLPDPTSDQPRWTFTVQVAIRGHYLPAGS